jgi:hypothetical protein
MKRSSMYLDLIADCLEQIECDRTVKELIPIYYLALCSNALPSFSSVWQAYITSVGLV